MRSLALGLGFVFALACSGSKDDAVVQADDVGTVDDTAADVAVEPADTATPCGSKVGDTLCDLDLQGYQRDAVDGLASSAMSSTFKTSEALAIGKQRYAFVFTTAYW